MDSRREAGSNNAGPQLWAMILHLTSFTYDPRAVVSRFLTSRNHPTDRTNLMTAMFPLFHVGILVADIEAAIPQYELALGVNFLKPVCVHVPRLREEIPCHRDVSVDVRITFSHEGPPHYELMEEVGGGLYSRRNAGIHHFGLWVEDCEERTAELLTQGLLEEAVQYDEDGEMIVAFLQMKDLLHTRIELVPERRRPGLDEWLRGGAWPQ
jgi:hypothetical protein